MSLFSYFPKTTHTELYQKVQPCDKRPLGNLFIILLGIIGNWQWPIIKKIYINNTSKQMPALINLFINYNSYVPTVMRVWAKFIARRVC